MRAWKKEDPIWLLRQCFANKQRNRHWRSAHADKAKCLQALRAMAQIEGEAVAPPALVIFRHCLTHKPDIDAPIKVILDAFQQDMLTTGDDKDIAGLIVVKEVAAPKQNPFVEVIALSITDSPYETQYMASEALASLHRVSSPSKDIDSD